MKFMFYWKENFLKVTIISVIYLMVLTKCVLIENVAFEYKPEREA